VTLPPFATLVEEHRTAVWGYLVAKAGPAAAADLLQDTLLSALRAYPSLRDASNLRGWLLSVARSRVIDGARARARRPEVVGDVPEREQREAWVEAWQAEPDDALWCAVGNLPEKQRHAVVLRFVGDLPYGEIAELVECSEAAARQNVRAGLARLRKELS
jgi:RNA polymerase sigma factor (sigma-70 family)